ncbi:hypothetical protein GCM10025868_33210 [Angustibacter aerolatus]|uniref:Uncharacterized protein n=1 Tax=Angustibacter aerolatus TaxID=1162965 RepID=A0ABQ6JN10_9ACTN|nr:hypothetical protein [Angustibacter aerolatus]GMA88071.1 hypothetical protein GCM10025868_33210 [Angustibacter aerolatus]
MSLVDGSWHPPLRAAWGAAPWRLRVAVLLVVPVVVLGVLRCWMAAHYAPLFVDAYGRSVGLDMTQFVDQQVAERDHPIIGDSALFGAVLGGPVYLLLVLRGLTRHRWSLVSAGAAAAVVALNALGSLGDPAPWWYHLSAVALVLPAALAAVLCLLPVSRAWSTPD